MAEHLTIGNRVAYYRRRRGMSQEVLAGLVGRTAEWLRKVENDRAELDRLSVIRALARALDIPIGDLLGEPKLLDWSAESGPATIPAIRVALHEYVDLTDRARASVDHGIAGAGVLEEVTRLWSAYQQSRYGLLARRIPDVLRASRSAVAAAPSDERDGARTWLAYAHQVATLFLTKFGEIDLALVAANRGLDAASATGDPIAIASLSRAVAHALVAMGEYAQARALAAGVAGMLGRELPTPTPDSLSLAGSLHLICALAAAREDNRAPAETHLAEARGCAERLGHDGNHVWTAFGPTNVAIHQVCVAMELGDIQRAIRIGVPLDTSALPVERRVRHAIEISRAYARWNRTDDALHTLLAAERLGPDQVRYHRLSRMVVQSILARPRPPRAALELSGRMGVDPRLS